MRSLSISILFFIFFPSFSSLLPDFFSLPLFFFLFSLLMNSEASYTSSALFYDFLLLFLLSTAVVF